jgi:hypothetical protein
MRWIGGLLFSVLATSALAQLAPNAPADRPGALSEEAQLAAFDKAIAPYVAKARATYIAAREKFVAGLPPRHLFFVTTRIYDKHGRWEQAFIHVDRIASGKIDGRIASDLNLVQGYRAGQAYSLPESDLIDWTITKPDGSEEGNVVGKFLDTYRP